MADDCPRRDSSNISRLRGDAEAYPAAGKLRLAQPVRLQAYGLGQDASLHKAYVPQIAEISTSTSLGNLETSTVSRAGAPSPK